MRAPAMSLLDDPTRLLFFTGKGGVGKTSAACAAALSLADRGKRVLVVSTDPASNLSEVLGAAVGTAATRILGASGLSALDIDPEKAAHDYRERVVAPYRALLPAAAVASIEEQLSGACTTEIAAFDRLARLLGDPRATAELDHVVFDTAPTGHTLRLLELPAAWSGFLETNAGGTSCLGPLSGLTAQKALYAAARDVLSDARQSTVVLVARPDRASLAEAERTRVELEALGVRRHALVLNGMFVASDRSDLTALALERRGREAVEPMPSGLARLARTEIPLLSFGLTGLAALRAMLAAGSGAEGRDASVVPEASGAPPPALGFDVLLDALAAPGRGVVMTMGKGGVGKTTLAVAIATELADRGHRVLVTTTDPAAHVEQAARRRPPSLSVSRIDPKAETSAYAAEVMIQAGAGLDARGRALLEEDLRSPCTEEIAVFRAFAKAVAGGEQGFVVIDTAPTGHTLLLLDAAEAYHREVLRTAGNAPEEVRRLLPRLRDPDETRILLVTLAEATPVHEAAELARDLERAGIRPFACIVNQALAPLKLTDPVLVARRANERRHLLEASALSERFAIVPWAPDADGPDASSALLRPSGGRAPPAP